MTNRMPLVLRIGVALGLIFGLGFAASSAGASGAAGTNEVVSSNPAANQVVEVPPTQLQMVFRDALASPEVASTMGLSLACDGTLVGLAQPQLGADGFTVSAALTQIPPAGLCTVSWALPDKSIGSFSFTSTATSESTLAPGDTVPVVGTDEPAVIGEVVPVSTGGGPRVGGMLGLLRILEYLLVAAIFGGLMMVVLAWPEGIEYGVCLRFFRVT